MPIADTAAAMFYNRLFEIDPSLRRMFAATTITRSHAFTSRLAANVNGNLKSLTEPMRKRKTLRPTSVPRAAAI